MNKEQKNFTREIIINKLVDALKPLDYVQAFWEGGAAAYNRIDEWSDIDIYIVADDEKVDDTIRVVEKTLIILAPIKQKLELPKSQWPEISQIFYELEGTNKYLVIDLAVLKASSPEKFLEPEIHGDARFYFSKSAVFKSYPLDKQAFSKKLRERKELLKAKFDIFNIHVQKEINRGNILEAIDLYHTFTLATLIETLRMKHYPVHYDFKTRYIHYELPLDIIQRLEELSFIKDERDMQAKYDQATKWVGDMFESQSNSEGVL